MYTIELCSSAAETKTQMRREMQFSFASHFNHIKLAACTNNFTYHNLSHQYLESILLQQSEADEDIPDIFWEKLWHPGNWGLEKFQDVKKRIDFYKTLIVSAEP